MLTVFFEHFPVLETTRCQLRQSSGEDLPQLLMLRSNEEVLKYVDKEKMESLDEAAVLVQKINDTYEKGEGISWAVCLKEKNVMIGQVGIWRIDKQHHRGEIGYTLQPVFWNKGIMSEVLSKVIHYGFFQLNLHSLEANVNPENKASIRLLEKMGFVREAYFKENYYFRGRFLDSAIYSLVTPIHHDVHSL